MLGGVRERYGGELVRIEIAHAEPIGRSTAWRAAAAGSSSGAARSATTPVTVHFIGAGPGARRPDDGARPAADRLLARCAFTRARWCPREVLEHAPAGARVVDTQQLDLDSDRGGAALGA